MIPDDYIDVQAEKIRIYKQLDSMVNDKEIDRFYKQIEDRFGRIPQELENLFCVVKLRNLGGSLGFEKIIVKNSLFILFFISNSQSNYYKTDTFSRVLARLADVPKFEMKQTDKLKLIARGVGSLDNALELLRKLR